MSFSFSTELLFPHFCIFFYKCLNLTQKNAISALQTILVKKTLGLPWQGAELPFTVQEVGNYILKTLDVTQRDLTSLMEVGLPRCCQQPGPVKGVPPCPWQGIGTWCLMSLQTWTILCFSTRWGLFPPLLTKIVRGSPEDWTKDLQSCHWGVGRGAATYSSSCFVS